MNTSPTHYFVLPLLTSYVYVCLCIQMLGAYGDKAELAQRWQRPELRRSANNLPSSCHLQGTGAALCQSVSRLYCHWSGIALLSYSLCIRSGSRKVECTWALSIITRYLLCGRSCPLSRTTCGHPGFRRRPCFSSRVLSRVSPNRQGCLSSHVLMRSQD